MNFLPLFFSVGFVKAVSYGLWITILILTLIGESTLLIAIILGLYEIKYSLMLTAFRSRYILEQKDYGYMPRILIVVLGFCILAFMNENIQILPIIIYALSSLVWFYYTYEGPRLEGAIKEKWILVENFSSLLSTITLFIFVIINYMYWRIDDLIYLIILRTPLQFLIALLIGRMFYKEIASDMNSTTKISIESEFITLFFVTIFIIFKVQALDFLSQMVNGTDKVRQVVILYDIFAVCCALLVRWLIVNREKNKLTTALKVVISFILIISVSLAFLANNSHNYIFVLTMLSLSLSYQNFLRDKHIYQGFVLIALFCATTTLDVSFIFVLLLLQVGLLLFNWMPRDYAD